MGQRMELPADLLTKLKEARKEQIEELKKTVRVLESESIDVFPADIIVFSDNVHKIFAEHMIGMNVFIDRDDGMNTVFIRFDIRLKPEIKVMDALGLEDNFNDLMAKEDVDTDYFMLMVNFDEELVKT